MRRLRLSLVAFAALVLLASQACDAQQDQVKASTFLSVDKLATNAYFRLAVVLDVAQHWHVNANPANVEGLIPTTLTLPSLPTVVIDRIVYPEGTTTKV